MSSSSSPPLISKVEIRRTARPASARSWSSSAAMCRMALPRQERRPLHLLYNPNIIYHYTPNGELVTLYDDWEQLKLVAPTNIALAAPT